MKSVKREWKMWCSCEAWKNGDWRVLGNFDRMNFCAFCGKKLVKKDKLRPVPKSIVGGCVGHYPDRRIYREIEQHLDEDPMTVMGTRLIRAHPASDLRDRFLV